MSSNNSTSSSIFYADPIGSADEFKTLVEKTYNTNLLDFETIKSKLSQENEKLREYEDEDESINNTMIVNGSSEATMEPYHTAKTSIERETSPPAVAISTDEQLNEINKLRHIVRKEIKYFESDKSYLYDLSAEDIEMRLKYLDQIMEQEIEELRKSYSKKRAVIEEAVAFKKKNSVIF